NDLGMAMPGRSHGNARRKVKELVAIHIFDHDAAAPLGNKRIRARVRRRNVLLIAGENTLGIRARNRSLELGADRQRLRGHGVLQGSSQFPVLSSQWLVGRLGAELKA